MGICDQCADLLSFEACAAEIPSVKTLAKPINKKQVPLRSINHNVSESQTLPLTHLQFRNPVGNQKERI
ncbi:hypothetical protein Ancab_020036 [Ancistrocladus abbreviatus]